MERKFGAIDIELGGIWEVSSYSFGALVLYKARPEPWSIKAESSKPGPRPRKARHRDLSSVLAALVSIESYPEQDL